MEEQKHKLLGNDQYLDYETDDTLSLSGVDAPRFSRTAGDKYRLRRLRRPILFAIAGLSLATLFYLLGRYAPVVGGYNSYTFKKFGSGHCGNSSTEALQNGCVLDLIPGAWVHPDCYDEDLEREFLDYGDWHWYADPEGKEELSEDDMRRTGGPNPVYVTGEYHDAHCAFTWRKLHRAVLRGTAIDSHIGFFQHTEHCSGALARARNAEKYPEWVAPSRFYNIYTFCHLPHECKWKLIIRVSCLMSMANMTSIS